MILKFSGDPDEVYFVDSTAGRGVSLNKWSVTRNCIGDGKFYRKCVFRHINFDRSATKIEAL